MENGYGVRVRAGNYYEVWIRTDYGIRWITGIGKRFEAEKIGEVYLSLAEEFDFSKEYKKGALPVDVVLSGKTAVAAYMYAVHRMPKEEIAQKFDVRSETIEQYISNARNGFS